MIKENFIKATKDWYDYISKDHHKDRDTHWEIGKLKRYSYGEDSTDGYWFVRHQGYITEFEDIGDTEEEVMEKATKFIRESIKKKI